MKYENNYNIDKMKSNTYIHSLFAMVLYIMGFFYIKFRNIELLTVMEILVIFSFGVFFYIRIKNRTLKIPKPSTYNPYWDVIEIHVENKAKGNYMIFGRICAETILCAKELGKNILFHTYHLEKSKADKWFGEAVMYKELNTFEKYVNFVGAYLFGLFRKTNKKYSPLKVYINVDKLTEETITFLEDIQSKKKD